MSIKHHYLKCETEYYQQVEKGIKTFELRKNDRDYQVGDIIHLKESVKGVETGREIFPSLVVTYILENCPEYGLKEGYCILQLKQ